MRTQFITGLAACLVLSFSAAILAAGKVTLSEQAMLQAAMQSHIDRMSVDGKFLHMNSDTGDVRRLRPRSAHPTILRFGEFFVLCSDFETKDGNDVNIDFYVAKKGETYVVFDQMIDNRKYLKKLMKSGKAERVD